MKVTTNLRVYEHIESIDYNKFILAKGRKKDGTYVNIAICENEHIIKIEEDSKFEFVPDLAFGANVATCVSCYCEGGIYKTVEEFPEKLRKIGATDDIIEHIDFVVVNQTDDTGKPLFPIKS